MDEILKQFFQVMVAVIPTAILFFWLGSTREKGNSNALRLAIDALQTEAKNKEAHDAIDSKYSSIPDADVVQLAIGRGNELLKSRGSKSDR